jgi:WD40 repeat protein
MVNIMCHGGKVRSVSIDSNERFLVSDSVDTTTMIWDLTTGRYLHIIRGHTTRQDNVVKVWKTSTGELSASFGDHQDVVVVVDFHPTKEPVLVSGGRDGAILQWDTHEDRLVTAHVGHPLGVEGVAFSADGWFTSTHRSIIRGQ